MVHVQKLVDPGLVVRVSPDTIMVSSEIISNAEPMLVTTSAIMEEMRLKREKIEEILSGDIKKAMENILYRLSISKGATFSGIRGFTFVTEFERVCRKHLGGLYLPSFISLIP